MSDVLLECDSFPAVSNTHTHTHKHTRTITNTVDKSIAIGGHGTALTYQEVIHFLVPLLGCCSCYQAWPFHADACR